MSWVQVRPRLQYVPLVLVLAYLTATVALFAWGPWRYPVWDGLRLYSFLALAHVALAAGYLTVRPAPAVDFGDRTAVRLFTWSLVATGVLLIPTSLLNTGDVLPNVLAGLQDPGAAYASSLQWRSERTLLTIVSYIRIVAAPLLFLLLPLLIVYWQVLGTLLRSLGIVALAFTVAIYISMGVNKGIADMLGIAPVIALASYLSKRLLLTRVEWIRLGAGWAVAVLLFLGFFSGTQVTRSGSVSEYGYLPARTPVASSTPTLPTALVTAAPTALVTAAPTALVTAAPTALVTAAPTAPTFRGGIRAIEADYGHALVRNLPPGFVRTGIVGMSFYVTHGYYALHLALDKPFVPMFGVGHSIFLTQQAVRITGDERIAWLSYPKRIEQDGWDALGLWSSIYPWIASDVSFPGTLLVVFLIGRYFRLAWSDALAGRNPFAFGMLAQFSMMLLYFPANNQTSQFGEGFVAFWLILTLWLATRARRWPTSRSS